MTEETLIHRITRLQTLIDKAKEFHSGEQLAQRIEGDLNRIMNSAYLNLVDAIDAHEQKTGKRDHICLTNRAFNSNRCLICGEEIDTPKDGKQKRTRPMINRLIADYRQRIADHETLRDAEQEALRVARKLDDPEHERAARCADIRCCNVLIQLCTQIIKDLEDLQDQTND